MFFISNGMIPRPRILPILSFFSDSVTTTSARTLWQEYLGPSELGGSSLEEVLLSLLLVVLLNLLEKFLGEFLRFCELFRGHFLG